MKETIDDLIRLIKDEENPLIIANKISNFITNSFRQNKITLYEAYMLHFEEIRFRRLGYTQSVWNGRVRIAICLAILNQKLLAHIFDENKTAEKLEEWGLEAYKLNKENRTHYIMDTFNTFLASSCSTELLLRLLDIRKNYDQLSDDGGPYHNEVFPFDFYSPEEIIMGENKEFINKKNIDAEIEKLIIELNLRY